MNFGTTNTKLTVLGASLFWLAVLVLTHKVHQPSAPKPLDNDKIIKAIRAGVSYMHQCEKTLPEDTCFARMNAEIDKYAD